MPSTMVAREDAVPVHGEEEELAQELQNMPLQALSSRSRDVLCELLDPKKIIPSPDNYDRYWPGLARLARIPGQYKSAMLSSRRPTDKVLELWGSGCTDVPCTLGQLQRFLQYLDRWDVYTDTYLYFKNDAEDYLNRRTASIEPESTEDPLITYHDTKDHKQKYHAFILHADADDDDNKLAEKMIDKFRKHQLSVCTRKDLRAGLLMELCVLTKLIEDRCKHLIVIFSPAFCSSNEGTFLVDSTMCSAIRKNLRMLIPVIHHPCKLPPICENLTKIYYNHSNSATIVDFWDRLVKNIDTSPFTRVTESASPTSSTTLIAKPAALTPPPARSAVPAALPRALPSPPTDDITSSSTATLVHTGAIPKKLNLLDKIIKRTKKNKHKEKEVASAC